MTVYHRKAGIGNPEPSREGHSVDAGLSEALLAEAVRLGFDLAAVVPLTRPATADRYDAWIAAGYHGEMAYLARPDAVAARQDPERLLPGAHSALVVATNYYGEPVPSAPGDARARGTVARYAWGRDYHELLRARLNQLGEWLRSHQGPPVGWRACVDSSAVLERDLAQRAGLGFVGKNTNLIHPRFGSWLLLGELLLTCTLPPGPPRLRGGAHLSDGTGTCGACTRCLDACPTAALVAPYILDARRCIAYLTIELKGPIPRDLRPLLGNRIFGCDVCQEVCPWNRRFAHAGGEPALPGRPDPDLLELLALDDEGFRRQFAGSSIGRARRRGLLRNVAVALGNAADPATVPALARALTDPEPLIRAAAAWALGRIGTAHARRALSRALRSETDEAARTEMHLALS